ncbi:F-box domain-containing protein [Artemisia annua]|uniref:F-box domain-containing protein n=1 Tax=Artemisia annua TaxID=35608 RepID=A0A2U1PJ69_ARTAN|nr:F-box domain-containing protein [Artemisia annua]
MSDNIPVEFQLNIVRRLPVKCLLQCRTVSKSWKAHIDTLHFTARFGLKVTNVPTLVLCYRQRYKGYMCFLDQNFSRTDVPSNLSYSDLKPVGYSHGVLGFSYGPIVSDFLAVVWNPSIRRSVGAYVPYATQSQEFEKRPLAFGSIRLKKASQCVVGGHIFRCGYEKLYANDVAGGTIASFQCLLNIDTPCQLKLIGFNPNNDPILEVQNPEGFAKTLGLYNIASGTFHNLGIEGDGGSFFIAPIGGLFGVCGIWVCIFLYRLAYGKSLEVDNPVQAALAYRERMANLYFKHRVHSW